MKTPVYVLFTYKVNNAGFKVLASIYSPDFELDLLDYSDDDPPDDYLVFAAQQLNLLFDNLPVNYNFKTLEDLKQPILHEQQRWYCCEIEFTRKHQCCIRILPALGHITNILTIATGCFATYMSFRIASNNPNHSNHQSSTMSMSATILNAIVNIIMYTYSDTSEILRGIGHNIDSLYATRCRSHTYRALPEVISHNNSTSISRLIHYGAYIGMMLILTTNMIIAALVTYQETNSLAKSFLDLDQSQTPAQKARDMQAIQFVIYLMIVTSVYSSLAFEWSFAVKFVDDLLDRLRNTRGQGMFFRYNQPSMSSDTQSSPNNHLRGHELLI